MIKLVLLVVVVIALLAIGVWKYNHYLKEKARKCSVGAKRFHEELKMLSDPSRMFTDKEVRKLKIQYAPLLETVNDLYDSYFISNDYLDRLGLAEFMEERKLLNHTQYVNNQGHQQ